MKAACNLLLAGAALALALGSPATAAAQDKVLTLDAALATALEENPSLAASRETVAAADARVDQAWSGFLPQVLVNLGYRRTTLNSAAPPYYNTNFQVPTGLSPAALEALNALSGVFSSLPISHATSDSYNSWSASLTVSETLWDFGKTLASWRAQKELREGNSADLATTRDAVRLQVVLAYYTALAAQQAVETAEDVVRQMKTHLDVAREQAAAGVRQRIDVSRAESDQAQAELTMLRARNAVELARVNLNASMGVAGRAAYRVQKPAPAPDPAPSDTDADLQTALTRRPELEGVRARSRATASLIDVAAFGYWPNITLSGGLSWQDYKFQSDPFPYNWFVGLSLTWNALSPIPVGAAVREAEATQRSTLATLRSLEIGVRSEVEAARLSFDEARAKMPAANALLASATETVRLAEGRYQAGAGGIVEVTDAQTVYTQARFGLIQAEFDIETARARLQKALGLPPGGKGE